MVAVDYLLQETSVGYGLYQVVQQPDTIGNRLKEVQEATQDLSRFGKMIKLVSFAPFQFSSPPSRLLGAAQALENANDISEGIANDHLKALLELNLPKGGKKKKVVLGISDKSLAGSIKAAFPGVDCETNEVVQDLLRGLRLWGPKFLKQLQDGDMDRAQLGLGHAYSRAKVKFSVQKNDNHIIQSIALLDTLDKDINTFAMRVREWYSWHFPELVKIVNDNYLYARLILFIRDKKTLSNDRLHELVAITNDDAEIAQSIIDAAKVSMGQDISDMDMENICHFAEKIVSLADYRKTLHGYLVDKMSIVAPNLAQLIGEVVGARLISHAGSLANLSKYPASTVQILGAEKALFRALKTKGNTPKYGLIYHSSFIGRAGAKNKGRISRFLANKCSIASRIDSFSDSPTTKFGEALRKQVEERLDYYANGTAPQKNQDAMKDAMDAVLADIAVDADEDDEDVDPEMVDIVEPKKPKGKKAKEKSKGNREGKSGKKQRKEKKEKDKKDKKDKESKKRRRDEEEEEEEEEDVSEKKKPKKPKKEKKSKA
ncbi:Nop-domain-containing protein [Tuber magnatum]|uniref:Nucleolar protein 56 n=1 Tax=Tuber magnatum TaxID=42249 RepID=A0A317SJ34_9PEZI|nr:Nop-domain-containing protein [Tuber magnatum]